MWGERWRGDSPGTLASTTIVVYTIQHNMVSSFKFTSYRLYFFQKFNPNQPNTICKSNTLPTNLYCQQAILFIVKKKTPRFYSASLRLVTYIHYRNFREIIFQGVFKTKGIRNKWEFVPLNMQHNFIFLLGPNFSC